MAPPPKKVEESEEEESSELEESSGEEVIELEMKSEVLGITHCFSLCSGLRLLKYLVFYFPQNLIRNCRSYRA